MKVYWVSLATGMLVGLLYGLLHVRSPAPPAIALVGLLGMLVGEQLVPMTQRLLSGQPVSVGWVRGECLPKITGVPIPAPTAAPSRDGERTAA